MKQYEPLPTLGVTWAREKNLGVFRNMRAWNICRPEGRLRTVYPEEEKA